MTTINAYSDRQLWSALAQVQGIGPKRFYQLLTYYGDIQTVFERAPREAASLSFIPSPAAKALADLPSNTASFLASLDEYNITAVTRLDSDYPKLLADVYDPPPVLFARGDVSLLNDPAIAIVGSRRATRYGMEMTERIASGLARAGLVVASGMARGIDTAAHQAALEAKGKTIAVLGCGLNICYPPENHIMKGRIESEGLIISEYAPDVAPLAQHFPARNRIISGISKGLVLVEAAKKSGAMITANNALEQGREVFAVPGSPMASNSDGPNALIQQGCALVTSAQDVLDALGMGDIHAVATPESTAAPELDLFEGKVVSLLMHQEYSYDELAAQTGFDARQLNCVLTMLELRGIIRKLPGNQYGI